MHHSKDWNKIRVVKNKSDSLCSSSLFSSLISHDNIFILFDLFCLLKLLLRCEDNKS